MSFLCVLCCAIITRTLYFNTPSPHSHTHTLTALTKLTHTAAVVGFTQETYTAFEGVQDAQEVTVAVLEGTLGTNFSFNVQSRPGGTATGE